MEKMRFCLNSYNNVYIYFQLILKSSLLLVLVMVRENQNRRENQK